MRRTLFPFVVLVIAAATAAVLVRWQSRDAWRMPDVVRIETTTDVAPLFPSAVTWAADAAATAPHGLLLRDGDLIIFGDSDDDSLFVPYRSTDGKTINLDVGDGLARIGGRVVAVSLDTDAGRRWLQDASESDLEALRALDIPADVSDDMRPLLSRVASANASVALGIGSEAALAAALPLFHPRTVIATGFDDDTTLAALAGREEIETLMLDADRPGAFDVLPRLPGLRALFLRKWDLAEAGPLPPGLDRLRMLAVWETELPDLSALAALPPELEMLSFPMADPLATLSGIERFSRLHTLDVSSLDEQAEMALLDRLTELRHVAPPSGMTQPQFEAFISAHPDLAVLDLVAVPKISRLAPLKTLTQLRGLLVAGPYDDPETLRSLTALTFLGVSTDVDGSADQLVALRQALPDALVVGIEPFCLGSGWILLLLPALVVSIRRRRARTWPQQAR